MSQLHIQQNVSLKHYHTFSMNAKADYLAEIKSTEDIIAAYQTFPELPKYLLGGGSNVIFANDYHGLVLVNKLVGKKFIKEESEYVLVKVGAGENWHEFVLWALDQNLGGIENLSLIPGSVGASPVQNIGAYGVEAKDVIKSVETFNLQTHQVQELSNQECRFGYRDSIFKHELQGKVLITHVTFRLTKAPHTIDTSYKGLSAELEGIPEPTIRDISNAVIKVRKSKLPDPWIEPNSGSFFKNPVVKKDVFEKLNKEYPDIPHYPAPNDMIKLSAAWLIDQAELKGKKNSEGTIGTNPRQALVLINYGDATGDQLRAFVEMIKRVVVEKFGVQLELEVNIV
jgi:UDP-N-acetylmuramate dehydrogenase